MHSSMRSAGESSRPLRGRIFGYVSFTPASENGGTIGARIEVAVLAGEVVAGEALGLLGHLRADQGKSIGDQPFAVGNRIIGGRCGTLPARSAWTTEQQARRH
jgi:hypothetical protein